MLRALAAPKHQAALRWQGLLGAAIAGLASEALLAELSLEALAPRKHARQALVARSVRLAAQ